VESTSKDSLLGEDEERSLSRSSSTYSGNRVPWFLFDAIIILIHMPELTFFLNYICLGTRVEIFRLNCNSFTFYKTRFILSKSKFAQRKLKIKFSCLN